MHDYDYDISKVKSRTNMNIPDFKRQKGRTELNKTNIEEYVSSINLDNVENSFKNFNRVNHNNV